MELMNYIAGGAALGLVASLWSKIKGIVWRIANLFVQQVEIHTTYGHNAIIAHLIDKYPRSRTYERTFGASYDHMRDGHYGLIPYEYFGVRTMIFWNGWFPFMFSNAIEKKAAQSKGNSNSNDDSAATVYSTITFIRGTLDIDKILKDSCKEVNDLSWSHEDTSVKSKNRFVIHYVPKREEQNSGNNHHYSNNALAWYQQGYYRLLSHTPEQLGKAPLHKGSALENLIFPQRVKNLIQEIDLWRNNRAWYLDKGIPWKRGWLLYGPPGTGKTALARAFAEDMNMPIYVFNLAEMSNNELIKAWGDMQMNIPCMALIEDIDNVFHGRENVARKSLFSMMMAGPRKEENKDEKTGTGRDSLTPLTFDCLLNCLDGVERSDGVFTIITTNDINKVDPALGQPRKLPDGTVEFISTRPGRIDKAVELTYMEADDKKQMAKRILGDYPDQYLEMLEFIDRFAELQETPAQFQERCGQIALACFWKEKQDGLVFKTAIQASDSPTSKEEPLNGSLLHHE